MSISLAIGGYGVWGPTVLRSRNSRHACSGGGGRRWSPFGSGIYFLPFVSGKLEIDFFDLNTRKVQRVFVPEKPSGIVGMGRKTPGVQRWKWLLVPQTDEQSSDLMMIENWQ